MNTHIIPNQGPLVYNGVSITSDSETLSLTDMWKAAGSPDAARPSDWYALPQSQGFVDAVAANLNAEKSGIWKSKRGNNGGTFAHWQIGLAYAKYLSPEFHMWCNQVVRERMEGKTVAIASLSPEILEMIRRDDGISRMLAHKVTGIESTVQTLAAAVAAIASVVQPPGSGYYVTGKTAGEIWRMHGFPPIKVTCWFSNRLVKMGCQMDGGRRLNVGTSRAKLFDEDKADTWLRNGGKALVEQYVKERQGQKRLRLVTGEGK